MIDFKVQFQFPSKLKMILKVLELNRVFNNGGKTKNQQMKERERKRERERFLERIKMKMYFHT